VTTRLAAPVAVLVHFALAFALALPVYVLFKLGRRVRRSRLIAVVRRSALP
jgi:hypothetical protein